MRLLQTTLFALAAATLPLSAAADTLTSPTWDKSYSLNGRLALQLASDDASIRMEACGGCSTARIHVDLHDAKPADYRVEESQNGNGVRFALKSTSSTHLHFGFSIGNGHHRGPEIIVQVPTASDSTLKTGNGSVEVSGVRGQLDVHTGDGSVHLLHVGGTVKAATGDGSVEVRGVASDPFDSLRLTTGDGSIQGEAAAREISLSTGDGSIHMNLLAGTALRSSASFHTGDGSVELRLPTDLHAELDLHSGSGSVNCDLPTSASTKEHSSLHGMLNGGGPALHVTTGDGSIHVSGL